MQQFSIISAFDSHLIKHLVGWEKPNERWKKVNVDATIFSMSGTIGLGWVLRDSIGSFLAT